MPRAPAAEAGVPRAGRKRAAVLLHGLWNTPVIMAGIADRLEAEAWAVANVRYPSRLLPVAAHGEAASRVAAALADDGAREIAFFGHSLGGPVARVAQARAAAISPPAGRDVLVIAGGTGARWFNPLIKGDDDGLIAVAETRLPGHEAGFVRVRCLHKSLPRHPAVIAACCAFLNKRSVAEVAEAGLAAHRRGHEAAL